MMIVEKNKARQKNPSPKKKNQPSTKPSTKKMAGGRADDLVLRDVFFLQGVNLAAKVDRNADGGLDWMDYGPLHDQAFMSCLNRHEAFDTLLAAWNSGGALLAAGLLSQ